MNTKKITAYFTDTNVDVTARIKNGKTKPFDCQLEAETYAKNKKSYTYVLFGKFKNGQGKNVTQAVGFAVPN